MVRLCSHSSSLNLLPSGLARESRRKQTLSALLRPYGAGCVAEVGLALCGLLFCYASAIAQEAKGGDRWNAWQFLVGEWTGEGGGLPGKGTGSASFSFDLEKKILVRRSRSDYPAAQDRPAYSHQDLMIIYLEPGTKATAAVYFDNEGHVIRYRTDFSPDQKSLIFVSDPLPAAPRFRLSYTKVNSDTLSVKFETAPPDKPESFSTYVEGLIRRNDALSRRPDTRPRPPGDHSP